MNETVQDVHTEHCCKVHGCKYMDENCTVVSGSKKQSHPCEDCEIAVEDFRNSFEYMKEIFDLYDVKLKRK